jgi:hypothetical protein
VRRRAWAALAAATTITLGALTGCGRETGARATAPARELTAAEQVLIDRAQEQLVEQCMRRAGYPYWVQPVPSAAERKGYTYVLGDVGWAEKNGYGGRFERAWEERDRHNRNQAYANALPQDRRVRYTRVLEGGAPDAVLTAELPTGGTVERSGDGCRAKARERLYGDPAAWFRAEKTAKNLTPLYVPQLVKDRRFVAALRSWAGCMHQAGHDYADPAQIREKLPALTQGLSADRAHAVEVELAVAEARCAGEDTSLADTARALEREYRNRRLGHYRDELDDYRRMGLTAAARAKAVVGTHA